MTDFLSHLNAARILIAENDPDEMDRLTAILEDAGYNVHKAYYVGDAIFALEHNTYALAVIDASLSDRSHHTLADHMAQFDHVKWIALVDAAGHAAREMLDQGAAAAIKRPVEAQRLMHYVDQILDDDSEFDPIFEPEEPRAYSTAMLADDDAASDLLKRRLIEQQTLSSLARSLSAELDLDVLLTQIVDAAVRLCNAEEGLLLLPDEDEAALYIRAVKGLDSETARNFRIRTQDTLAGQVYRTGKPILLGDQGMHKLKTEYLVRSLLYVPLSIKGTPIGVLGLNNRHTDRTFGQHDSELLQDLAAHAAVAIENARLYKESVLRTRELSTLVQAADAANSTLALDRVLSIIANQLIGALDVAQCYITEWQPDAHELHPLAIRYRALWKPPTGPARLVREDSAIESLLATRQPVMTTPPENPAVGNLATWLPHQFLAHSVLHVPLYAHERLLGIATFYRMHQPYPERIVPQAATTALHRIALQMVVLLVGSDATQQRENLFRLADDMLRAADADWCEIALWNAAHQQFDVTLSYGEVIWQGDPRPHLDLHQLPQVAALLDAPDVARGSDDVEFDFLCNTGYGRSMLMLPLTIKEQTVGLVFLVDTLQDRQFTRREIELAQALVSQAANALDNARLYRDLALSLEKLHRTQSKLVQTARLSAMGELAAAVAHQINNPLTTILGDAEMMLQDVAPDDTDYEALEAILRAGKRAHEVVRRLLTMARQHSIDETLQPVDVNDTVQNTLALVKSHIQQGNVMLHVDLAGDLPYINGIQGQLEDVWLNLLLNARDAVTERSSPKIGIITRHNSEKRRVEVIVWDNGMGIPADELERVFEPFYTTKPTGEGTGLGLHICMQIVEKCQGSISVHSQYNQGTRFTIYLPVYSKREQDA